MMVLSADPRTITETDFPTTGTPAEQWRFLLNYALLAPSEYNTQPWLFSIEGECVDLYADSTRRLPVVDPQDRELLIGCSAAFLNLRLAVRHFGRRESMECFFHEQETSPLLARLRFGAKWTPTSEENRLFSAILARQSNRSLFQARTIPQRILDRMQEQAGLEGAWLQLVQEKPARQAIADLILEGDRQQWAQRSFREELAQWLRLHDPAALDGLPGSVGPRGSAQGTDTPPVVRTFDLWREQAEEDRDRYLAAGAPVLAVLGTFNDTPGDWFVAGMAIERVLLEACASGLQTSFVNQPIEVPALRTRLCRVLGRTDFPQVIIRMGYSDPAPSTPRRSVQEVLLHPPAHGQRIASKEDESSSQQEGEP